MVRILDFDNQDSAHACLIFVSLTSHIIQLLFNLDDKGCEGTQSMWFVLTQCQGVEDGLLESILEMIYLRGFISQCFGCGFHEPGVIVGGQLVPF